MIDDVNPLLSDTDWKVLRLIYPILEPFMLAQKNLEGAEYVTGILTIVTIGKCATAVGHSRPQRRFATGTPGQYQQGDADCFPRRGSAVCGFNQLLERRQQRPRVQGGQAAPMPGQQQVCATDLDPRAEYVFGIRAEEPAAVWKVVADEAV